VLRIAEQLSHGFDLVWVQDQMLARNVYAMLAAIGSQGQIGVGTNVTYPVGRNPVEMAASFATIRELVPEHLDVVMGMGTGGALVTSLYHKEKPIQRMREAMDLMRRLWAGESVPLGSYPALASSLGYRPDANAKLTFPVEQEIPIVLAGVGPKILHLAGECADGIISASNFPTHSYAAFKSGKFAELSGLEHVAAGRSLSKRPEFRLIFGINCSVSRDRAKARAFARRQLALVVGNPSLWPDLEAVGLDVESASEVKAAFDQGLGIDGAVERMSDSLADGLIVSGTPDECIPRMLEIKEYASQAGYTEFYVGAPLGPDLAEAAELLVREVVPAVWPERAGVRD
jgi:alkanesulfonate monooxygenase SsuD/methylene tetrahydromethanopterin reductase-like flavin-dependent oxidoreductase (luciferase family)